MSRSKITQDLTTLERPSFIPIEQNGVLSKIRIVGGKKYQGTDGYISNEKYLEVDVYTG